MGRTIIIMILGLYLSSCNPCNNLDCPPPFPEGQFKILSLVNGNDLVFGSNKIYNKDQIKFYSLKGADTIFLNYEAIWYPGDDSLLAVRFLPEIETAYIKLNNSDTDTLKMSYKTHVSKCCGTITSVANLRFNNQMDIRGRYGIFELKK